MDENSFIFKGFRAKAQKEIPFCGNVAKIMMFEKFFKDQEIYKLAQSHDFSEICITSSASILYDDSLEKDIEVISRKASGKKCAVCWKIRENVCNRDGHCHLA